MLAFHLRQAGYSREDIAVNFKVDIPEVPRERKVVTLK